MSVAIIDYGSGNLHSARKAFERAAREAGMSREIKVTARPEDVLAAEHVVLPGVGAFADCRRGLDRVAGMVEALEEAVPSEGGLSSASASARNCSRRAASSTRSSRASTGSPATSRRSSRATQAEDPPHGLEHPRREASHPLLDGIRTGPDGLHAYFVHSYQLYAEDPGTSSRPPTTAAR